MSFLTVLAHTETDHNNFLSSLISHFDMGWLFVFVGIVFMVTIVVVGLSKFSPTTASSAAKGDTFQQLATAEINSEQLHQVNQEIEGSS